MKKIDVYAMGNAIVDYEIEVEDSFFDTNNIKKGIMSLVDEATQKKIIINTKKRIKNRQGGGSAANTIFTLSQMGGKGFYSCKVANDEDGQLFLGDLEDKKIMTNLTKNELPHGITGKCLIMISPDAERTMSTCLGITQQFSKDEIIPKYLRESKYLFIEGFLVSTPEGLQAIGEAKKIARNHGVKIAITFSDPSMILYFKEEMKEALKGGVDLLFCNLEESQLFTDKEEVEEVELKLREVARQFVVTLGKKGAIVFGNNQRIEIPAFSTKAVDTTGAGDIFAGTFLYGLSQDLHLEKCGRLASLASSKVVSQFGPRLNQTIISQIKNHIN